MKKLMIAAAVAAMGAGAFAACEDPDPEDVLLGRVYQMQLNCYTTQGRYLAGQGISAGRCEDGEAGGCIILRGKDKTVIRGYVWICDEAVCSFSDYYAMFKDIKRKAPCYAPNTFDWCVLNAMGPKFKDAEGAWDLEAEFDYGEGLTQTYTLKGAGYGAVKADADMGLIWNNFSGYFAGTAEAPYDLKTKRTTANEECICERSQVVNCESWDGESIELSLTDADTVAFGMWKMKYNARLSAEIVKHDDTLFITKLIDKL